MTQQHVAPTTEDGVRLGHGAMQNWSDLALGSIADAAVVREVLEPVVSGASSVLLVGAHSLELVAGLAQTTTSLSMVTRSIPDARAARQSLAQVEGAEVWCSELRDLLAEGRTFDLVLALDDLDRVVSLETGTTTWESVLTDLSGLVAPGGRVLLGVENELGLHRLASLRSRYAANDDSDWAVLTTFDPSRPRTEDALRAALAGVGLAPTRLWSAYADWLRPVAVASTVGALPEPLARLLGLVCAAAPTHRREVADPSRVTKVASQAGLLGAFASGWLVDASPVAGSSMEVAAEGKESAADDRLLVDTGREVVAMTMRDGAISRPAAHAPDELVINDSTTLLSERLVDACAAHRLPDVRELLEDYAGWLRQRAVDDVLDPVASSASFDNVLDSDRGRHILFPGQARLSLEERVGRSLGDLVATLRQRGSRHPWPAATDDVDLVTILAAMAGVEVADPERFVAGTMVPSGAAHTVAGLLAVVERLEETNMALASRARWFERRLNERERELRTLAQAHDKELRVEQARQESLRCNVEDLKNSVSFRAGKAIMAPLAKARDLVRRSAS